jgi:hypothetical protein
MVVTVQLLSLRSKLCSTGHLQPVFWEFNKVAILLAESVLNAKETHVRFVFGHELAQVAPSSCPYLSDFSKAYRITSNSPRPFQTDVAASIATVVLGLTTMVICEVRVLTRISMEQQLPGWSGSNSLTYSARAPACHLTSTSFHRIGNDSERDTRL